MKLKSIVAGVVLLSSGSAFAGATGNVGAFSEYLFRGVEQTNGPAVQGGVDYAHDSGLYVGTWISNVKFAALTPGKGTVSYETDVYGGWSHKFTDLIGIDVGAYYYFYADDTAYNTIEAYAGLTIGSGLVKVYYSPSYFGALDSNGDEASGYYVTGSYAIPVTDSITITPEVGYSGGDGPKAFFGTDAAGNPDGEYVDYSVTLAKTLDAGFTFTFGFVGTNLDTSLYPKDKEKLVLGLKKTFDL